MKNVLFFSFAFSIILMTKAQDLNNRFKPISDVNKLNSIPEEYYLDFLNRQSYELETAHQEVFVLNSISWVRNFGDKYYYLTPTTNNIKNYTSEKLSLDNDTGKSSFYIMDVELTSLSKNLLKNFGIDVPEYVNTYVRVMLPLVDLKTLQTNNIQLKNIKYPKVYTGKIKDINNKASVIFSEGFESNTVPGSQYQSVANGTANCSWKDVSCTAYTGNWSVWCAGNGAACNSCPNDYVNDMFAEFLPTNLINTTNYTNIYFKYALNYDFYNIGSNDELGRYDTFDGSNWNLKATFNSTGVNDGLGWNYYSISYVGQVFINYAFDFVFVSNGVGTSGGTYIDDISLEGTPQNTSINELQNVKVAQISPNPSVTGIFNISSSLAMKTINVMDVTGRNVKNITPNNSFKTSVDISSFEKGIYFLNIKYLNNKYEVVKVIYLDN